MTYVDESQGMGRTRRTVSAFFDDRDEALDAVEQLRDLGIAETDIRLTSGAGTNGQDEENRGFFEMLGEWFFPSDDREAYAEGLQRGGHLVTVSGVSDADYDDVVDILDNDGAVDMDERTARWRSEGWRGRDGITGTLDDMSGITGFDEEGTARRYGGAAAGTGGLASGGGGLDDPSDMGIGGIGGTGRAAVGMGGAIGPDDGTSVGLNDETVEVVEERLLVGKRDASRGGVRVRSYVVEEPVSETVTLHEERVDVERRPVDRRVTDRAAAFQERSIEAEEHGEEAVVDKEARVVEEIGLRKTATSREETISDTLRRTEVEVEDDRDDTSTRGTRRG
ncbi:YsnF/AvaK domain-containing protein [Tabrizicola sp. BL-A-41-H6]|uniref:YsnF/AvaK domain-containing protein n=1 Tax=Tabrizicola sp. BL-A-41-H6 TaxID=3421107 RepID=UPI003D6688A3